MRMPSPRHLSQISRNEISRALKHSFRSNCQNTVIGLQSSQLQEPVCEQHFDQRNGSHMPSGRTSNHEKVFPTNPDTAIVLRNAGQRESVLFKRLPDSTSPAARFCTANAFSC